MVKEALTDTYGNPLGYQNGQTYGCIGSVLQTAIDDIEESKLQKSRFSTGIIDYDEWVVEFGDILIKIDLVLTWFKSSDGVLSYSCELSYTPFTNEEKGTQKNFVISSPPTPTPAPTPVKLEVDISAVRFGKNSIGTPELYIRFKNTSSSKTIDRIDFAVECYDVYGSKVKGDGYYDYTECYFDDQRIKPGKTSPSNHYWTLYGFEGMYSVKIAITKYHTTDGRTVSIPEKQWTWEKWTPN